MTTDISGRNFDITPDVRTTLDKKLNKLEKLFADVIDVRCVLKTEKYRNICEITIVGKDHDVKTMQQSDASMREAIDLAVDHLKRQAQKNREKLRDHRRKDGNHAKVAPQVSEWSVQVLDPARLRVKDQPRIIRTNNLPIRPMSIEEAALRLDDSKNEFIVFRDLDTDKVAVIYKRRDNHLGLISPQF